MNVSPLNPAYKTFNELWTLYAIAKNPQLFQNDFDISDVEYIKLLETLEEHMKDLLDGLPAVFLDGLGKVNE